MSEFEKQIKNKFGEVVTKDKEMAELALDAVARADRLSKEAARIAKIKRVKDTDLVKEREGKIGREWEASEYEKHDVGFRYITKKANGKPVVVFKYINPETGRQTSVTRTRDTLAEAIIARNEIAATLFREGLIDFEKFLSVTQN